MNHSPHHTRTSLAAFAVCALLAVGAVSAQVASGSTGIDASGRTRLEVRSCLSGATQQDRDTCLKEARNAKSDKRRGALTTSGNLEANAMARCDVFTASDDKAACQARVMGMGNTSGSVAGGGVIRSLETVVPVGTAK